MYIGNILIPYVDTLSTKNINKDVKINNIIGSDLSLNSEDIESRKFTMGGVVCDYENRDVTSFANDIEAIANRNANYNKISYENIEGFLSVESGKTSFTAESIPIRPFDFNGSFFPLSKYQTAYQLELDYITNDYNIKFPSIIALPVYSYNVRVTSAWDTIALEPIGTLNGIDGDLQLYRPFELYDELNYNSTLSTGETAYLEEAHGCITLNIDAQTEFIQWDVGVGVDVLKGVYKTVFRIKDDNITDDIKITITDSEATELISETFSTGGTDWTTITTSAFQLYNDETITIKIEKLTTDANTIEIDYAFLSSETINSLVYDCDTDVNTGEIKVYDTTGSENESEWQLIYDDNHVFDNNTSIVIQNSIMRWKIELSEIWGNTGQLTNLKNGQTGQLYPIAFANNNILFNIKRLTPDTLDIYFYLANGDSDYNADSAKELVRVRIRPHDFIFELKRYGSFSGDWYIDWSNATNYIGSYCADSQFVSTTSSDLDYTSTNSTYLTIFDDSIFTFTKSIKQDSTIKNNGGYLTISDELSDDYMFAITFISGFGGSEYLFKSDDLSVVRYNNLELEELVSGYDSTMFSNDLKDSAVWSWSTDHLNISSGVSDTDAIKILKSYEYSDISSAKIDLKFTEIGSSRRNIGMVFSYKDSQNYYYAVLSTIYDSIATKSLILHKVVNGVDSVIATSSAISDVFEYYDTLDVEINDDTFYIYLYDQGTSRTVSKLTLTYTDISLTKVGNIGICALAEVVDGLDVDFQNFIVSGENIYNRGVLVDTIYDDLNWDTQNEYIVNEGTLTKWSHDNDDLCINVISDNSLSETETLDNIQLNSGDYKCQVKINSSNAVNREAGFIFASKDGDVSLYYSLTIELDASDNAVLNLKKFGSAPSTVGTYGVGGYGIYGYGGVGSEVILAQGAIDYSIGEWGVIECEYNHLTSMFSCYYYRKGESKPSSVTCEYMGDNYYTVGNVGFTAKTDTIGTGNIDVSFKNLIITSTNENDAVDGKFLSAGGVPHGSKYNDAESIIDFNSQLSQLEYAKYNLFTRTKTIDGSTSLADLYFEDQTTSETLSIEKSATHENITANTSWTVQNEILNIGIDNYGNVGYIGITQTNETTHDKPIFLIDFISLIPISSNLDSEYVFPYDISYESFNDINYIGKIVKREFETKILDRISASYTDLNYIDL